MDKFIVESLGLFTLPPQAIIKNKIDKQLESQLMAAHKDFYTENKKPGEAFMDQKETDTLAFVDKKEAKRQKDI